MIPGMSNPFAPRTYGTLHRVTDRVYIYRNITNSSFVIGDDGVCVIDTQVNPPLAEFLLKAIRSVTDKPIRYVVNTHYHWDHTNGNQLFKQQGAEIIASKLTHEFMQVRHHRQKEFLMGRGFEISHDPLLPETLFEGEKTIDLGNMPLRLFFAGKAESDDATAVWVEKEKVLMAGDTVMTGSFPIFGQPVWDEGLQGDGLWQGTIEKLMSFQPKHIIPGHGPLASKEDVALLLRTQNYFCEEVGKRVAKGMELTDILNEIEPQLPGWITRMPVVWGNPRYAILRVWRGLVRKQGEVGWQQFKPLAIPQPKKRADVPYKEGLADYLEMAEGAAEGGDMGLRLLVLKTASERFDKNPDALSAYADALIEASRVEASVLEKGDFFQAAKQCWEKALSLQPNHAASLLGKGRYWTMMAYRGGENPLPGMELLERAHQLSSEERIRQEAQFYLGMGHRRLGDEKKAKEFFQSAMEFSSKFMPARLALQS